VNKLAGVYSSFQLILYLITEAHYFVTLTINQAPVYKPLFGVQVSYYFPPHKRSGVPCVSCKRLIYSNRAVSYSNKAHTVVKEAMYGKSMCEANKDSRTIIIANYDDLFTHNRL